MPKAANPFGMFFCGKLDLLKETIRANIMDKKAQQTLAYPAVLAELSGYCDFPPSKEKALNLQPSTSLAEAEHMQNTTAQAFDFLSVNPEASIGEAQDIRECLRDIKRRILPETSQLLALKHTLIAARNLQRLIERRKDNIPLLWEMAERLPSSLGIVDRISRTISEKGEILDSASEKLGKIRKEQHIRHERLLSRLQRMVKDPKINQYLQENIITQRDGRYVLPIRADFKGKIKAIVHDQSASGATIFIEPLTIVEMNNRIRELQLEERDEQRRILAELVQAISEHTELLEEMIGLLAEIDLVFAKAKYAEALNAHKPVLHPMKPQNGKKHPGVVIRLLQARHPLLNPETVVPIDIELDSQTYAMVITGPNTGGKTVTLKTIGLLVLMAQSGLHIPTRPGSEISVFGNVFADIGDEQSIEQSLSTFSSHITNIIRILAQADRKSLVLLDELGAGTDPQEGAALARALLDHLLERGIASIVTTHHPELKAYAHATPGIVNACVEFDLETLKPTYHLTIGLPGRSNALAIAERLGLPKDIIKSARTELDPLDSRADELLTEIHRQRKLTQEARQKAEEYRRQTEKIHLELTDRLNRIEEERIALLEKARREAQEELQEIKKAFRRIRNDLRRISQPAETVETIRHIETQVAKLEEQLQETVLPENQPLPPLTPPAPLKVGSKVRLRSLNAEGIITALSEEEAEVQVGNLRVRTRRAELEGKQPPADRPGHPHQENQPAQIIMPAHNSPGIELDLRGKRADEALDSLESYLDKAFLTGLPWVRIIHGKGSGKLREVVRSALKSHPHVRSFEAGKTGEGGDGVTIAIIRP